MQLITKTIRTARDDEGVALITVIGVMVVVTALAIGAFTLARQSLHEAQRTADETRAFRAAAAGLDDALSAFDPDNVVPVNGSTPDGTYHVTCGSAESDGEFLLTSKGYGIDGSEEVLVQRFYYFNLWKMNFAGIGPQSLITGTSGLNGSSHVLGPFYMKGNLEIDSNMSVREGPLFVKNGNITVTGSGLLGETADPIKLYCDMNVSGTEANIHIASRSVSVPDINLPKLTYDQLIAWSTTSQLESFDEFMGSAPEPPAIDDRSPNGERLSQPTAYKFFGDASSIAPMGEGTYSLTLGDADFGSWSRIETTGCVIPASSTLRPHTGDPYTSGDVNIFDDFAYIDEYTNDWDVLFINGTVFVDGPITFTDNILYVGNGTIVANGDINVAGWMRPWGDTNSIGEQNRWALGLVTPTNLTVTATSSNTAANVSADELRAALPNMAGAFYADDTVTFTGNNMIVRGSILAGHMEMGENNTKLVTNPLLPDYLPSSLPGAKMGLIFPGNWSRE